MKAILAKAIRQILFVAGGAIGAKSTASDSDVEAISGAVMIVGSLLWSWYNEWSKRRAAAKTAAMVGLLTLLLVPGCGTTNPAAYKSAGVIEATADRAMTAWVGYYQTAILQPGANIGQLADRRAQVDASYNRFRAAMNLVYTARANYNNNSATTPQLEAALQTAAQLSAEVLKVVNTFLPANQKIQ